MSHFPDQTVSESKKKSLEWIKEHFDHADALYQARKRKNDLFTKQFQKYNGETTEARYNTHVKLQGKETSKQWVDYRFVYTKVTVLNNEYMKRPLPTYVFTRNRHSVDKKQKKQAQIMGMYVAKNELKFLRDIGLEIFGNAPAPENEDALKMALNIRTKNEMDFSNILQEAIHKKNMKVDFARNNMHIIVGMRTFGKVELYDTGAVEYRVIDPRNEIGEDLENDPFGKRRSINGAIEYFTASELVMRFGKYLTKEQTKELFDKEKGPHDNFDSNSVYYRKNPVSNNYEFALTHIEWNTLQKRYYQVKEDKKDPGKPYRIEIKVDEYEDNKEKYDNMVTSGKIKIDYEYGKNLMEAYRIGQDIYPKCYGYKKYCLPDKKTSYTTCLVNEYDGRSLSLVDLADEFAFLLNSVMLQLRETIRKYIPPYGVFDEAYLPADKDKLDVMVEIIETGLAGINSRATGNASGTNLDQYAGLNFSPGLPLSDLQSLIILKNDLKRDIDEITAINKEREGATLASQTATAAKQNISQSRVISYHLNMYSDLYVREVLEKYIEYVRISHAFIKNIENSGLLDELGLAYVKLNKDVSLERLGVQLANIEREIEVRERLNQNVIPIAMQKEKIEVEDYLRIELAETVNEMVSNLEQSMDRKRKITESLAENEHKRQMELSKQQNEGAAALQNQLHQGELDKTILAGQVKGANDTLNSKNQALLEREKRIIEGQPGAPQKQPAAPMQ